MPSKKYYWKNPDKYRKQTNEYRLRNPEKHREGNRKYYQKHKKEIARRHRKWRERNKEKLNQYFRNWKKDNPKKYKAHYYISNNKHKFPLNKECELCPEDDIKTENLERHHPDYDYPEIYVTVCDKCHQWIHGVE